MKVKFGDVVNDVKINIDRNSNPYKYYVAGDHMDSEELRICRKGCFETDDVGPAFIRLFKSGQVLYGSRRTYLKKVAVADFEGICANTTFVLESKDNSVFDQHLLPFIMLSDSFTQYSVLHSKGSTNPYILFSDLANYEFELPPLEKQKELAKILWAGERTRQAYKKLLQKTDEVVKAKFEEMFSSNEKYVFLEECSSIHARVGWQALKKEEYMPTGEYMLITGTDFVNSKINYSTCVYVSKNRYDMDEKIQIKNGDILVTKDGTIGKVAIVEGLNVPATLNAGIFVIRPDERFNSDFFSYLFKSDIFSSFVESVKSGSTIKHLNQCKLQKYMIPLVPIELQNKFAAFSRQADQSKQQLQKSLDSLNSVMRSLVNQNFNKGE